jgi:hypothetical protein
MRRLNDRPLFGDAGVAHQRNEAFVRPERGHVEKTILGRQPVSHAGFSKR